MEPVPIRHSLTDRKSAPLGDSGPGFFKDENEKMALEARNCLLQFDRVGQLIEESGAALAVTPGDILDLQCLAIWDIYPCAGTFRNGEIGIRGSLHTPPPSADVPNLVQEMCDYANNFPNPTENPLHVASYLMWRHNWIHPFKGGNGRTSRALSYLALCVHLGTRLPGKKTIPEQIIANRALYYSALDEADAAWARGVVDVSAMESLVEEFLTKQLQYLESPSE